MGLAVQKSAGVCAHRITNELMQHSHAPSSSLLCGHRGPEVAKPVVAWRLSKSLDLNRRHLLNCPHCAEGGFGLYFVPSVFGLDTSSAS